MDPVVLGFLLSCGISALISLLLNAFLKGRGPQSQPDRPSGPVSIGV